MTLCLSSRIWRRFNGSKRISTVRYSTGPKSRYEVVVVGGGVMGSSSAYFLASRMPHKSVCVVERDFTYTKASSMRSVASIRQQFSCPENIQMSLYSIQFLKNIDSPLHVEGEDKMDVGFVEGGYLFLATEVGEEVMRENHTLQRELGASVELLSPIELSNKFPWLSTEGIVLASFATTVHMEYPLESALPRDLLGYRNEGYFDPWLLLSGLKRKAISLGVDYISAEATDINLENNHATSVKVQSPTADGVEERVIDCDYLVNAAGPWAGDVASMAGIGKSNHHCQIMRTGLPVEPRLRSVFVFKCPTGPTNCPLVIDGCVYWRGESNGTFLTGFSPPKDKAADVVSLDTDHSLFDDMLWPVLARRVPAFEELKVQSAWSGFYEYNTLDQNAIIGAHPVITNYIFANGFSGHGIQMSPAVGRAISEIILDGKSHSIDLTNFSFQRVLDQKPYSERLVV